MKKNVLLLYKSKIQSKNQLIFFAYNFSLFSNY